MRPHRAGAMPDAQGTLLGRVVVVVLVLAFMAPAVTVTARALASVEVRLDRMAEGRPGDPLPPGWSVRTVSGVSAPASELIETATGTPFDRAIRFEAEGEAAFFWLELDEVRDPAAGHLTWRWQVDASIPGARLSNPSRDDAPARFFVAFGDGGLFSAPRMIFYSWGGADEIGERWAHDGNDDLQVMVLRNETSRVGTWLQEVRDLEADHRALFGSPPDERVTAVGFMIDTDATGERAASALGPIEWVEHGTSETGRGTASEGRFGP